MWPPAPVSGGTPTASTATPISSGSVPLTAGIPSSTRPAGDGPNRRSVSAVRSACAGFPGWSLPRSSTGSSSVAGWSGCRPKRGTFARSVTTSAASRSAASRSTSSTADGTSGSSAWPAHWSHTPAGPSPPRRPRSSRMSGTWGCSGTRGP